MKKLFLILIILLLSVSIFAIDGSQKTYSKNSDEYNMAIHLCKVAGVNGPSEDFPVLGSQIYMALEKIDRNNLDVKNKKLFDSLLEKLDKPTVDLQNEKYGIDFFFPLSTELYSTQTNDGQTLKEYESMIPYRDQKTLGLVGFDAFFSNNLYLNLNYEHKAPYPGHSGNLEEIETNVKLSNPQTHRPMKIITSLGNEWMNITFGRDRISLGNSELSNLIIGDNFSFQEFVRLSFFMPWLSYSLNITNFCTQSGVTTLDEMSFSGMHQTRIIHKFAVDAFDNFRITITQGAMIYNDIGFDFRYLMPLMFLHNYMNFSSDEYYTPGSYDEANNILAIEFEYTLPKEIVFYANIVSDQWKLRSETQGRLPNAIAFQSNLKKYYYNGKGIFAFYLEGTYTSPFLYLNPKINTVTNQPDYNHDYIVGYSIFSNGELSYSGFKYGPDCIAVSLGAEYRIPSVFNGSIQLNYIQKGEKGIPFYSPITCDFTGSEDYYSLTGIKTHSYILQTKTEWNYTNRLSFSTDIACLLQFNRKHVEGADPFFAIQTALGVKYTI